MTHYPATCRIICVSVLLAAVTIPLEAQAPLSIRTEERVVGMLTTAHARTKDGYHQHYLYEGVAGERLRVSVTARHLEAAVAIYPPATDEWLADDGGGRGGWDDDDWTAFAAATLPVTGQYTICVHSHRPNGVGEYDVYLTSSRSSRQASAAAERCLALGDTYAESLEWFRENSDLSHSGIRYQKYGLPRVLGPSEVRRFSALGSVGLYAEPNAQMPPRIIYVPVRACEFQPYTIK